MTCDRERKDARRIDRLRCERRDNPPAQRPDPDWLLAEYARVPAPAIADRLGVTATCVYRWIGYARERHIYNQELYVGGRKRER